MQRRRKVEKTITKPTVLAKACSGLERSRVSEISRSQIGCVSELSKETHKRLSPLASRMQNKPFPR